MAMVIMAVSDLHGELSWLPAALDRIRPQLLLCAGDWGDPGQLREQEFMLLLERAHVLSVYG
ncbi:MAG TPA: metallophosphoesterase, partial [Armatimonadota bacterium]|nr:metallophosphoesterase [Armatimonadota bacterium]